MRVSSIEDFGVALVNSGVSADAAGAYINNMRDSLVKQLTMLGLTTDQANAYVDALGLTPKNITTAVKLSEVDKRKQELQGMLTQLGDIDAGAAAEITVMIDQGNFTGAEDAINQLARDRGIVLNVAVNSAKVDAYFAKLAKLNGIVGADKNAIPYVPPPGKQHAQGAYIPGMEYALLHPNEAVLPLSNQARMAQLLGDPRIGGPVASAIGASSGSGGAVATMVRPITANFTLVGWNDQMVRELRARLDDITRGMR